MATEDLSNTYMPIRECRILEERGRRVI